MKSKYYIKKLGAGLLALSLLLAGVPAAQLSAAENTQTTSPQMSFRNMTADEIVAEMGNGWNLGNTMDGHTGFTPSETLWQNVETSQKLVKEVHDMGFNTIRVPVTWGTMIDDANGYAIDEKWMSRVQDIVDYAVNMNMYVIINIHHDGAEQTGWLRVGAEDIAPVKEKFEAVWKQIAERFKDYDEHVIFESMNEVTGPGSNIAQDTAVINELNQLFVDTVRAVGSNNAYRWLSVPGRYTNILNTTNAQMGFALPKDSVENRLFVAVHYYDWHFGMLETTQTTSFSTDAAIALRAEFQKLEDSFTSKGVPVILGEYGAINKMNTGERAYHMEIVTRICQQMGIVPCYWDQGWYDLSMEPDFSFTIIDRENGEPLYPEIIAAMMRGMFLPGKEDFSDIVREPSITPITDLGTMDSSYLLHMGEVIRIDLSDRVDKAAYNDVILWKSADETVATVNPEAGSAVWAANVHAAGIGNTIITAYSQSGKAVLEIPVEVKAGKTQTACTEILVEQESYNLTVGESLYLDASMAPADTDAFLTYRSTDTEVVTVSKIGKIVALQKGSAYIVLTSSDGLTKVVPVTVEEAEASAEIALALNVYYNDSALNYFSNESGSPIIVKGDGQYTLSFDCGADLSAAAAQAGVTGLSNLTAIYIKDDSVTKGIAKKSPLVSCDIIYDRIAVDGVEYAITMPEPKSALKASGIFDTNDPVNSWDGSVIDGVEVNNHVLNFADLTNPQKIEVTFTVSNLIFEEGASEVVEPEAASLAAAGKTALTVSDSVSNVLSVEISPVESGKVAFVSSDVSVVSVSNTAIAGAEGVVTAQVYAHGEGEATVTAYTDNGLTAEFQVTAQLSGERVFANVETEKEEVEALAENAAEKNGTLTTIFLILGIALLGIGVFVITLKIAGGGKPSDKGKKA